MAPDAGPAGRAGHLCAGCLPRREPYLRRRLQLDCNAGAHCLLDCGGHGCTINCVGGHPQTCAGNVSVCGEPCPSMIAQRTAAAPPRRLPRPWRPDTPRALPPEAPWGPQ